MGFDVSILAKDLPDAKQRLRPLLGRSGATRFAERCLQRVIEAVLGWTDRERVRVVTNGPATAAASTAWGASAWLQRGVGLAAAAREALTLHPERPRLLLMADLPLLASTDLAPLAEVAAVSALVLVPDRLDRGLNALVVGPGIDFAPELGHGDGWLRNRTRAERCGLTPRTWSTPALAHDCDTVSDYEAFLAARRA